MLRPNKRFLRHIIRDTDTHNRNLLAKEAAESRARLKDLERTEELKRQKTNPNSRDIRKRQMGDIHAILGGKKRRKEEEAPGTSRDGHIREDDPSTEQEKDLTQQRLDSRRSHGRLSRTEDRHNKKGEKSRRDERRKSARSRSRGSDSDETRRRHNHKRNGRSASPRRRRQSQSPRDRKSRHRHRSPTGISNKKSNSTSKRTADKSEDDSDPLEDFFGPAPPPRYRGRGALGSSGIDRRFSETYDPRTDVQMDEDEAKIGNNWNDSVEAFRDRQKLKQNQETRLREAGFGEDEIQRANGNTKVEEDVRWSKAGEKREWDRGKDVDSGASLFSEGM